MSDSDRSTETVDLRPEPSGKPLRRRLVLVHSPAGADANAVLDLARSKKVVLGRAPGRGGLVIDDPGVSRAQAEITYVARHDVWRVRDLGSKNGTLMNGRRMTQEEYLSAGAVLRLGSSLVVYSEAPADTDDLPPPGPTRSLALAEAEAIADRVAPSAASVLIVGPCGAGKELLARRIHAQSGRTKLVSINCAALARDLVEAELFGHARGAFTGAIAERSGVFQSADGGTLFLDEIGTLALEVQPKLLRALEGGWIRPIGADEEHQVDVRVIAATNQDLAGLERRGHFRRDLLARVSRAVIHLPGLERRREEILRLFFEELGSSADLAPDAAEALLLFDYPHNVRDIQRAAHHVRMHLSERSNGLPQVRLGDLPSDVRRSIHRDGDALAGPPDKERFVELLEQNRGNVSAVARELKQHRNQIHRWLKLFALEPNRFRKTKRSEDDGA